MSETDALSKFDFGDFLGSGKFLKFEAGKPVTLRVLTVDPVVKQEEFRDKQTDEVSLNTRFYFLVYNFTHNRAQILPASPGVAKRIGDIHADPDFGANIRKIDIKITPTGEQLKRRYEIQVLPTTHELTNAQIKEAQQLNLDTEIPGGQRMSFYKKPEPAVDTLAVLDAGNLPEEEPIDLDDIPF